MEQTGLFIAGATVATAIFITCHRTKRDKEVLEFVRTPHTRSVLRWLSGKDGYCVFPNGFNLQDSEEDLNDGTILGLIKQTTFQEALVAEDPSPDQIHLRCIIQETLLRYAGLAGTGAPPLGLGAWPALLKKHEAGLRKLLSASYPLVLRELFPVPWFKRFIPGFGKAAK